jgi:hypothetical protein
MFPKHSPTTDPHANGNNATHARLLKRLTSLQNSMTLTSKNSGRVVRVSSPDPAEVDRVGTYLTALPALNLTGGGVCAIEATDLYVNFKCDTQTANYNDPNWLTQLLVSACDLNTTALSDAEVQALDHFCNDGPNQYYAEQHSDLMVRYYFSGSMLLLFLLCCCAFILGRRNMQNADAPEFHSDRRGGYRPLNIINPDLLEAFKASQDEKKAEDEKKEAAEVRRAYVSQQMNGL